MGKEKAMDKTTKNQKEVEDILKVAIEWLERV